MSQGKEYFEKRIKLIEILNKTKDENGISKINNEGIQRELNICRTNLNKLIRDINSEEKIITKYKEWYIIKVKNINEIERYRKMAKIIEELTNNLKDLYEDENLIAKKYKIERTELQRIKTIIKNF